MKRIPLGNSQLSVSRICMGCMGFGDASNGQHSWTVDEEQTRAIIKRGLELGINFFDTAIAYQSGTSEQYLGRALKDFAKRDEVVVATKFLPRTQEEIEAGVTGQQHIERMLNTSLKNLGMDYVDLYIYHMWDYQTPLYDILDGLNRVVKAGKARYIGISNCLAYQLAKANALAREEGFAQFVSIQGHYNLIFREEEREMAKLCREDNIAMTPYSALAGGRLSKHPGETSKRLQEDSYARLKYDATAQQDAVIPVDDDRDFPCLAAAEGDLPRGGRHQAQPRRGRGQGGGPCPDPGGNRLPGGAVSSPQTGGCDGAEHPCRRQGAARLVHRQTDN